MPGRYEQLYLDIYGTAPQDTGADPANLIYYPEVVSPGVEGVQLIWDPPVMSGATHVAIFRRSGTDLTPFEPWPSLELARVTVDITEYVDEDIGPGSYVYQAFPLIES